MKKTIWKFELEIGDNQKLELPIGAEILTVHTQNEIPCLWALVDPDADQETRHFEVYGTGHPVRYDSNRAKPKLGIDRIYIGTFQLHNGILVFHVFEYTGV